jgi:hypothetical protein
MNCLRCHTPLPPSVINTDRFEPCPTCGAKVRGDLFPAAFAKQKGPETGAPVIEDGSSECFYHPGKKAVVHCGSCGRFLCSLCDVDLSVEHICFSCLETGKKKKKRVDLENHRTLYDGIALNLAILPLLFFWITLITAPLALYFVIRYYKTPTSIIPRTRFRFILAGFFSICQIVAWGVGLYVLAT